ncbi:Aldehyde dehydrogenase family protein [Burkholderia cepacia]|nr:Aldehyde dehydrogenase family protein [Burkholderia cepacia]
MDLRDVGDAIERGARVLAGGKRLAELGPNYYAPTVLADATADMQLTCEETFGPIAALFRFDTEDEAVGAANDTPFGLAAYLYTQDVRRIARVSTRLETGIVGINEGALASEAAPFGEVKESGYGREGSRYGLDDYLSIKYLCQGGPERIRAGPERTGCTRTPASSPPPIPARQRARVARRISARRLPDSGRWPETASTPRSAAARRSLRPSRFPTLCPGA